MTDIKSRTSLNFGRIRSLTLELRALGRQTKFPWTYRGENGVSILAHSILIASSSHLLVSRAGIKSQTCSNPDQIVPVISE